MNVHVVANARIKVKPVLFVHLSQPEVILMVQFRKAQGDLSNVFLVAAALLAHPLRLLGTDLRIVGEVVHAEVAEGAHALLVLRVLDFQLLVKVRKER